jgi:hypothetical protein
MALDYLVDTNVVLRALTIANPQKAVARQAIKSLLKGGADLCIVPQNIVEFWGCARVPRRTTVLGKLSRPRIVTAAFWNPS